MMNNTPTHQVQHRLFFTTQAGFRTTSARLSSVAAMYSGYFLGEWFRQLSLAG